MRCSRPRARSADFDGDVLVLYGDVPFVSAETMRRMLDRLHEADAPPRSCSLSAPPIRAPMAGSISDGRARIAKMVEYKDASEAERGGRPVQFGPDGGAQPQTCSALLGRVGNDNAAGEYYLPDIVMIALADGRASAVVVETDPDEVRGHQQPRRTRRGRGAVAGASREEAMAGRRHAARARDGVLQLRHRSSAAT